MREEVINGHQILSDGRYVWVNGLQGEAVARFNYVGGIDIHHPLSEQGFRGECLDCRHGPMTDEDWPLFVELVQKHFGVLIADEHKPIFHPGVKKLIEKMKARKNHGDHRT